MVLINTDIFWTKKSVLIKDLLQNICAISFREETTYLIDEELQLIFGKNELLLANYRITNSKRFMLAVGRSIDENFVLRNKLIEQRDPDLFKKDPKQNCFAIHASKSLKLSFSNK